VKPSRELILWVVGGAALGAAEAWLVGHDLSRGGETGVVLGALLFLNRFLDGETRVQRDERERVTKLEARVARLESPERP
jgi:hypothetical protein